MKKLSLIVGLGLVATAGSAFAAWTFNAGATTFVTRVDEVTVTIDDQVTHAGNHGTLILTNPTIPALRISQKSTNTAGFYTVGQNDALTPYTPTSSDKFVLTYTPAAADEPEVYSFTVNYTVTIGATMATAGMSVTGGTGTLYVSQTTLTAELLVSDVMSMINFPTNLNNYTTAKAFVDALSVQNADLGIHVAFTMATDVAEYTVAYRLNNSPLRLAAAAGQSAGIDQYATGAIRMVAGDCITFRYSGGVDHAPVMEQGGESAKFESVEINGQTYLRVKAGTAAATYYFFYKDKNPSGVYISDQA